MRWDEMGIQAQCPSPLFSSAQQYQTACPHFFGGNGRKASGISFKDGIPRAIKAIQAWEEILYDANCIHTSMPSFYRQQTSPHLSAQRSRMPYKNRAVPGRVEGFILLPEPENQSKFRLYTRTKTEVLTQH
mmetsp:Transcript_48873/g.81329  ORF Transcript_48873/g.81329 Transcript_48873/m.81329 type:complete len:131 (-) Transcript_48873:2107-2499(-)